MRNKSLIFLCAMLLNLVTLKAAEIEIGKGEEYDGIEHTLTTLTKKSKDIQKALMKQERTLNGQAEYADEVDDDTEANLKLSVRERADINALLDWFQKHIEFERKYVESHEERHIILNCTKAFFALNAGICAAELAFPGILYSPSAPDRVFLVPSAMVHSVLYCFFVWFGNNPGRNLNYSSTADIHTCENNIIARLKEGPKVLYEMVVLAQEFKLFLEEKIDECAYAQNAYHLKVVEVQNNTWWRRITSCFREKEKTE